MRVIVAHEFGHAAQNIITNDSYINWGIVQWNRPLIWLNQEGAATHFSRQTAPGLHPSIYFSYNDGGHEWLLFAEKHAQKIKMEFAENYSMLPPEQLFKEWFSIHGGEKFGYSRLAYFLGDQFFQSQIKKLGEMGAVIAWGEKGFIEQVQRWLYDK